MPNTNCCLILDEHFRSDPLIKKYKREYQIIQLSKQCPHLTILVDDFPFLLQILRINFPESSYFVNNFKLDENNRWKHYREIALFMADNFSFNYYFNTDDAERFLRDKQIMMKVMRREGYVYFDEFPLGSDREFMMELCKENGKLLKLASRELKQDRELVLTAVRSDGNALSHASEEFRKDRKMIFEAVKQGNFSLDLLDELLIEILMSSRKFVLAAIQYKPEMFSKLSEELKKDPKVLETVVLKKIEVLNHAPPSYQSNRDFVLKCVKNFGSELEYAHASLRKDREIILEAVKTCGKCLRLASTDLKLDREIVLNAVKQDGFSLEFADESLRNDKEIVLEAVKQSGYAVRYASDELKQDFDVVLEVSKSASTEQIHPSLRTDKRILLQLLSNNKKGYFSDRNEFSDEEKEIIRQDRELLSKAIVADYSFLNPLPSIVDKYLIIEALKNGMNVNYIPTELRHDADVMLEAFKLNFGSFAIITAPLRSNREFLLKCAKESGYVLSALDETLKMDREIALEAVKTSPYEVRYVDAKLIDSEFILEILKHPSTNVNDFLSFTKDTLMKDQELFLKALVINPKIADYLKPDRELMELALQKLIEQKFNH